MPAAKLADFEERFTEVGGARLRYFVAGRGRPLVLVHGLGGGAANWGLLAPELARRYRVLALDLPGHAGSAPFPGRPDLGEFADAATAAAEQEGLLPAVFAGHSFGGIVSLRAAIRRPDGVRAVALFAAAGISSGRRLAKALLPVFGVTRPGRVVAPLRRRIASTAYLRYGVFTWWGAADPPAMPPAAVEGFLAPYSLHTDTLAAGLALLREDPRADLEEVRCPAFLVWGARDNQLGIADAFEYARRLRAPLRVIADCGHLLIGERPDACLDALSDWIGELEKLPVEAEAVGESRR
jgi:pimeloyl-ACP methyl ester carboxylesterase